MAEYADLSRRLGARLQQHERQLAQQSAAGPEERVFHDGMPLMHKRWKDQKKCVAVWEMVEGGVVVVVVVVVGKWSWYWGGNC